MSDVAIYALFDPRDTKHVRYIGATTDLERAHHEHIVLSGDRRGKLRVAWILALRAAGIKPAIAVVEKCSAKTYADRKRFWIDHYAAEGDLLNIRTGGGENAWEIKAAVKDKSIGRNRKWL